MSRIRVVEYQAHDRDSVGEYAECWSVDGLWVMCAQLFLLLLFVPGITYNKSKINNGVKEESATASAYHEATADELESDAIESETETLSVSLMQVGTVAD